MLFSKTGHDNKSYEKKINLYKKALTLLVLCVLCGSIPGCASKDKNEIVKDYAEPSQAAEVCGLYSMDFCPEGYSAMAYRTVYDIVFETEYAVKDSDKTLVFRAVSNEYNVSNLSGYTDTSLADIYQASDGRQFEIEAREGVYACEWTEELFDKSIQLSLVLRGGELSEHKMLLAQFLDYVKSLKPQP